MNESAVAEQPTAQTPPAGELSAPEPIAELSILEHAKAHSPEARQARAAETPDETADREAREHHSQQQRREKDNGQWKPGKVRHRAQSQQASPEDVPRIRELTARNNDLTGRLAAAEGELAKIRHSGGSATQIARAEQKVEQAERKVEQAAPSTFREQEPDENDPKFGGDYGKYLRAVSGYEGRKASHDFREGERHQANQAQQHQREQQSLRSFGEKIDRGKGKYQDFEQVALGPTRIPTGGVIDAFISEDDATDDLLYYLNHPKNAKEVDELLGASELQQVKRLSLLSQRLSSPPSAQAAKTGSAAGRTQQIVLPPRPPNPVRTEAQRASDGPPPTDGSLSVMGHAKHFRRS